MSVEVVDDAVVAGCLVGPAAGLGIVAQVHDVGELSLDYVGPVGVGNEVVALLADVGVAPPTRLPSAGSSYARNASRPFEFTATRRI